MPRVYSENQAQSLGEELRKRRALLQIPLEEISKKSGIPTKYLRRLERGEWESLPGEVYTKGMLRRYAKVVGVSPEKLVGRYEKESRQDSAAKAAISDSGRQKVSLSPRTFRLLMSGVVVVAVLGYIAWQLSPVLARPALTIVEPAEEEVIVYQDSVVLRGMTEPGVNLYLNSQPLSISGDGEFAETIELLPGLNILEVEAISRFGKQTTLERKIIYQEN